MRIKNLILMIVWGACLGGCGETSSYNGAAQKATPSAQQRDIGHLPDKKIEIINLHLKSKDVSAEIYISEIITSDFPFQLNEAISARGPLSIWPNTKVSYVQKIEVKKGGDQVPVPLSALIDMFYVKTVDLEDDSNGYALIFKGSTGTSSWTCALYFENQKLIRRVLMDDAFDGRSREETFYFAEDFD